MPQTLPCPCGQTLHGKALPYANCCGRWIETDTPAPDAQLLMRSRYSAFVLERAAYLLETWHASVRPSELDFEPGVKWLGLEVRSYKQLDATHAQVEFVARSRSSNGRALRLHERSRFVFEEGRWFYVDGVLSPLPGG